MKPGRSQFAFSSGIPVICLFGPCVPEQYGISEHAHVIYKRVYCSPCVHDFIEPPCNGDNVCMQLIQQVEVLRAVEKVMEEPTSGNGVPTSDHIYEQDEKVLGIVRR